jgi:hypothetical protein
MPKRVLVLLSLSLSVFTLPGDLRSEQLLQGMPEGFKVYSEQRRGNILTIEMVPEEEMRQNWTEMVTLQVFFGGLKLSSQGFYDHFADLWKLSCSNSEARLVESGTQNGYPFALGELICPLNPASGKPEHAWLKAIEGNENFYAVQKSWRRFPQQEEISRWMNYLRDVQLCDSRIPERSCP